VGQQVGFELVDECVDGFELAVEGVGDGADLFHDGAYGAVLGVQLAGGRDVGGRHGDRVRAGGQ
jgi:hypothetical protein